eukprot:TRINITY_DN3036_c0_g1_i1.p1 TRINITY_DN3036_c0_g1~~TRINITY_DN3036_c0_g1_i1.p1  ORF type:complete len:499 (+),score=53.86 TRINITY_DN3036_c0_g1_i1:135-1499(+)
MATMIKRQLHATPGALVQLHPHPFHAKDMLPCAGMQDRPVSSACTNWIHSYNGYKRKSAVFCCLWTPEGRRLLTGNKMGEIAVLNGFAFNSLHQFSAHIGNAVHGMVWANTADFMMTASGDGHIYYWQPSMVCVKDLDAHPSNPVRQISLSPSDMKFSSASDDGHVKIWDTESAQVECTLSGHGSNVTGCDWHPNLSLVASSSSDRLIKLWDPRDRKACVATMPLHQHSVSRVKWNPNNPSWLLSGGKDFMLKLSDIRTMKEIYTFKGHKKEVTAVDWHPVHPDLFVSGCQDGSVAYWVVGHRDRSQGGTTGSVNCFSNAANNHGKEVCHAVAQISPAHQFPHNNFAFSHATVWDVKWHPLGNMIASVGHDTFCKVWGRNKPGQTEDGKELRPSDDVSWHAISSYHQPPPPQHFNQGFNQGGAQWNRWNKFTPKGPPVPSDGSMTVSFNDDEDE